MPLQPAPARSSAAAVCSKTQAVIIVPGELNDTTRGETAPVRTRQTEHRVVGHISVQTHTHTHTNIRTRRTRSCCISLWKEFRVLLGMFWLQSSLYCQNSVVQGYNTLPQNENQPPSLNPLHSPSLSLPIPSITSCHAPQYYSRHCI